MDDRLKQRLVGAVVLVAAVVVFVPMLLDVGDEASAPRRHTVVPPSAPEAQPEDATARVIPLDEQAARPQASTARRASAEPGAEAPRAQSSAAESDASASASEQPAKESGFAVQLGSFSNAGNARGLRDRLVAKGYSAYTVTADSITRVYVGPQPSRAAAEQMLEKLLSETKLKGIVVEPAG